MNLTLWIFAGVLGTAYAAGGALKLTLGRDGFVRKIPNGAWAAEFAPGTFLGIGVVEALGGLGILLPGALDIAPVLVPVAASGMALYMAGAATNWLRRGEVVPFLGDLGFLAACLFIAWGRFGLEPFGG